MAQAAFARARPVWRIRRAWPHEAPVLGALAERSIATWGYAPEERAAFAGELRVAPESLVAGRAFVLEAWDRIAGFYVLSASRAATIRLDHLFVEPSLMGRGMGTQLLGHAREQALRAGHRRLRLASDPHAERFYRLRGAARLRRMPSGLPGRSRSLLEIEL
jgi:GNAT superfamily N-acetyltransferase